MSGIAGLYHTDGRPVDKSVLRHLLDAQSHRGPDGTGTRCRTAVALGHLAMHTTPEAPCETQPEVGREGHLVLTADARIDNRVELISELGPGRSEERPVTDADLIVRAYRQWGNACPEHLRGAFAFAIWDARKRRLFCARDRMGLRPFHYSWSEPQFTFGSEINALLAHPAVSRRINDTRVADFLARIHLSNEYTFYEDILRLPPGHCAVIDREGMHIHTYWELTLPEERDLGSEAAYAEAFREVFSSAVEDRTRANGPVGSFLSGGLDSSSVTTMAREVSSGDLHTFSATYDQTPSVDEREYIRAVLDQGNYQPHFVDGNDYDPLKEFPEFFRAQRKATLAHTPSQMWMLNRAVREAGLNVVLDGHGGDEVTSHGHGYPKQLARERRWGALLRDLRGRLRDEEVSWPGAFLTYWLRYGHLPNRVGTKLLRVAMSMGLAGGRRDSSPQLINPDLARRTQIARRRRRHREEGPATAPTERQYHFRQVASTIQPAALEELNHLAGARSVESRFPFWDPRVVRFCLSLPASVKRRQGVPYQSIFSYYSVYILGFLLHDRDYLTLHASAVEIDGGVAAFIGPKGMGKSTTASVFYERGHRVLSDDMIACGPRLEEEPQVDPGFPWMKLGDEALRGILGRDGNNLERSVPGSSKRIVPLGEQQPNRPLPRRHVYALGYHDETDSQGVRIEPIGSKQACLFLLSQSFVQMLLNEPSPHPQHLNQCAALPRRVRVSALLRPRSMDALSSVYETVREDLGAVSPADRHAASSQQVPEAENQGG